MGDGQSNGSTEPTREELDAKATALGVESPEDLKNKEAVEEAIADAERHPRYTRQEVLDNARALTGYSRHLVAGALHGDDSETFSADQAKRLAKQFAERKVDS